MKELNTIQKREKLNKIYTMDEKGNGGAYHKYQIRKCVDLCKSEDCDCYNLNTIVFQNGARLNPESIHGIIDADLVEIVRHRLQCFQEGNFANVYNEKALEHLEVALMYMNRRVEDRIERNVLGTDNK